MGRRLMGTPSPSPSATIDVTPSVLYGVSSGVAAQQGMLDRGIKLFLDELARYPDGGGRGTAVREFAKAYKQVSRRYLQVWAKSVVSVGGAAVGFTTTGNNYAAADAATHPSPSHQPTRQPAPIVVDKAPAYGPVTDFKWGDVDDGQDFVERALEGVEAAILTVLRPLLEDACRWGKAAEILPLPNHLRVNSISETWRMPQVTLSTVDGMLTGLVGSITDQHNSEWYSAMRTFCSTLWGTSAWGRQREGYNWANDAVGRQGANHPVFAVLFDTCETMVDVVYDYAKAAEDVRDDLHRIYRQAVIDTLPDIDLSDGVDLKDVKNLGKGLWKLGKSAVGDLSAGIVLNMDEGAMNQAVTEYNNRVHRQVPRLEALLAPLDEAYDSAPTFNAEVARAEAFGARALTDFKGDPLYTVPGDDESNHKYPLDLANQEGVSGAHVIDKHVGKTDEQLGQRLRDQARLYPDGVVRPIAVSTFNNLGDAQRYTQAVLDDPENQKKIEKWLTNNRPNKGNRTIGLEFANQTTGRTWSRGDSQPHDSDKVQVTLRYRPGGHPPYVVLTSTPSDDLPQS
ncbi:RNase A-like domain-containing protein [Streptomyces sp. NPDC058371]|uniref:RNase A-like domain-containing protein n=1 Tax=Streptomyces sp. NPDC058371 TaxID=3346463 RepID=UPI00365EF2DC